MKKHFLLLILSLLFLPIAQGKVKLPAMMGDHMVLQQNSSVKLWGWADGKKVTVTTSWNNRTYQASTDKDGTWLVKVDTPEGGYTPYSITISDGTPVTLSDILIGEVWICSGQSNMEMRMMGNTAQPIDNSLETLLNAGNYRDRIRFITVPRIKDVQRRADFKKEKWKVSTPETTIDCSATAYFFAKQITETLNLPVGLVINSWGGSRIESWMTEETLSSIQGIDIETAKSSKLDVRNRLGCLYDIMLWPVKNYTARGFLWYQGESNIFNYQFYAPMMTAMVQLWRNVWEAPDMPFYYVQIAPYKYENSRNTGAALLREAQVEALKTIPNSGIVPTTDIGDEFCIHPPQKDVVGLRLATLALTKTYGIRRLPSNGPMMTKVDYADKKAIVTFDNAPAGLFPTFSELEGFEIAGADKKFYPAKAKIVGRTNTVEVWSEEVAQPVAVRYAFRNYVGNITLRNTFGLSAFPFRTDTWDETAMLVFVTELIQSFDTVLQRPDVTETGISLSHDFCTHGVRSNREIQATVTAWHSHTVQSGFHHCIQVSLCAGSVFHATVCTMRTFFVHSFCIGSNYFTCDFTGNFQYFIVRVDCIRIVLRCVVILVFISVIAFFQLTDTLHHRIVQVELEFRMFCIKVWHFYCFFVVVLGFGSLKFKGKNCYIFVSKKK